MPSPLDALVGRWTLELRFPAGLLGPDPVTGTGWTTFEWLGEWLLQRSGGDAPGFPEGLMLIGPAADGPGYLQHYYDSRGVHRLYAMTLEDGVWTLSRDDEDFAQRYTGRFTDDGRQIEGAWERGDTLSALEHDFALDYTRAGS